MSAEKPTFVFGPFVTSDKPCQSVVRMTTAMDELNRRRHWIMQLVYRNLPLDIADMMASDMTGYKESLWEKTLAKLNADAYPTLGPSAEMLYLNLNNILNNVLYKFNRHILLHDIVVDGYSPLKSLEDLCLNDDKEESSTLASMLKSLMIEYIGDGVKGNDVHEDDHDKKSDDKSKSSNWYALDDTLDDVKRKMAESIMSLSFIGISSLVPKTCSVGLTIAHARYALLKFFKMQGSTYDDFKNSQRELAESSPMYKTCPDLVYDCLLLRRYCYATSDMSRYQGLVTKEEIIDYCDNAKSIYVGLEKYIYAFPNTESKDRPKLLSESEIMKTNVKRSRKDDE